MSLGDTFDQIVDARCAGESKQLWNGFIVSSARQCAKRCEPLSDCNAALYECRNNLCHLFSLCLHRETASGNGTILMHRQGARWPTLPKFVRWQTRAALVIASYGSNLHWLQRLPANATDVVIMRKIDYGLPTLQRRLTHHDVLALLARVEVCMNQNRSGTLDASLNSAVTMSRGGRFGLGWSDADCQQNCACGCHCGNRLPHQRPRLAYFQEIPNYGETKGKGRGGSREPSAYLTFLLEFRDNLPPVIIFTQDDCGKRFSFLCRWGQRLPELHRVLQHQEALYGAGTDWRPPDRSNCLCEQVRSRIRFGPVAASLLNRTDNEMVNWPQKAIFAVSRLAILAQNPHLLRVLYRLVTVERHCGPSSLSWSHMLERMWFAIFDRQINRTRETLLGSHMCTAHSIWTRTSCT